MFKKRGQSVLEYVIVLVAIVAAIVVAAATFIPGAMTKMLKSVNKTIVNATDKLPGNP